jgi:hypothetical protein
MKNNKRLEIPARDAQATILDLPANNVETQEFTNVVILTHTENNSVSSLYANSLSTTVRLCMRHGIRVFTSFIGHMSNPPMAKNELLNTLRDFDYKCAVFIDENLAWDANSFLEMVLSPENVVGLPVVKKVVQDIVFDLDMDFDKFEKNKEDFFKVKYASAGFLKLNKEVIDELLDTNISITNNTGNEIKNVFEYKIKDGKSLSDSIALCDKIKDLGYNIWLSAKTSCASANQHVYAVDLIRVINDRLNSTDSTSAIEETPETITEVKRETTDDIKSLYE